MQIKTILLLISLFPANFAQGSHLNTQCSSADQTYKYSLIWSWNIPKTEQWTFKGKDYPEPTIEQLEPRIELFKYEDPMISRVEWVQKLKLIWQTDTYEGFVICKSFFGF